MVVKYEETRGGGGVVKKVYLVCVGFFRWCCCTVLSKTSRVEDGGRREGSVSDGALVLVLQMELTEELERVLKELKQLGVRGLGRYKG